METQQAEIASSLASAEVESDAQANETEVSATSGDETTAAASEGTKRPESPEKKRDEVQERFDKLTRERYEAQARAEIAEERRAALEARLAALEQESKAKHDQVAPDSPPTLEQFGYDEAKYQSALYAHLTKTVGAKLRDEILGEIKQEKSQREQQETFGSWQKRSAEFAKSNPDFVEKVQNARTLPISHELQQKLLLLEDGPQIAYELASNPEKAGEIMRLPLEFQLMEVGRIRGAIEAKKAAPKPQVSQAPPPPAKVEGIQSDTRISTTDPNSDRMSDSEWVAAERRRLANKARRNTV